MWDFERRLVGELVEIVGSFRDERGEEFAESGHGIGEGVVVADGGGMEEGLDDFRFHFVGDAGIEASIEDDLGGAFEFEKCDQQSRAVVGSVNAFGEKCVGDGGVDGVGAAGF